jgi:cell division protein FtsZ
MTTIIRNLRSGASSVIVLRPNSKYIEANDDSLSFEIDDTALKRDAHRVAADMSLVALNEWSKDIATKPFESSIETLENSQTSFGINLKIIGVGGGGGNVIEHMIKSGMQGVEFIAVNTDAHALLASSAHKVIQLGKTGLGAGANSTKGRAYAEDATENIRDALKGAHMLFIVAGMGGGTGTGAAPVISKIAKEMGILNVGIITKPFSWEGVKRIANANSGAVELEKYVDSLMNLENDELINILGDDITLINAFDYINKIIEKTVDGIIAIIKMQGHVNPDFEDVCTIFSAHGKAAVGIGIASGLDRARIATEKAMHFARLFEPVNLSNAKRILVTLTGKKNSMKLKESKEIMNAIRNNNISADHIIYGTAYDDALEDSIKVTVLFGEILENPLTSSNAMRGLQRA